MESDKEMLRRRNYIEALGDNYTDKPIYVMLFENGECIDQLEQRFESEYRAKEWLISNNILKAGETYALGNINNEWL
jgi:hypothetical protein